MVGPFCITSRLMVEPVTVRLVSMTGAAAVTRTSSVIAPSSSLERMLVVTPAVSTTLACFSSLKFLRATVTS